MEHEPLHPYWVEFAKNCFARRQETASWLALLNGTDWNMDPRLVETLNKLLDGNDPFGYISIADDRRIIAMMQTGTFSHQNP
jgi:hypothetical protein